MATPIGYTNGNKHWPVYAPKPGTLTTQAFIICSQCLKGISGVGGPQLATWCLECTKKQLTLTFNLT